VNTKDSYIVKPLQKAIEVLKCVGQRPEPMALKEIAARVGLPKTTAFRYLRTFEAAGMLVHERERDVYRIDPRTFGMLNLGATVERLRRTCLPYMRKLQRSTGETVNLAVIEGSDIVYLAILAPSQAVRFHARVGGRDPVHTTSLGKAVLANWPVEAQNAALPRILRRRTPLSVVDLPSLKQELDQVRTNGFAQDNGENEQGASAIGAPLFNASGNAIAAISVAAPTVRLTDRCKAEISLQLMAATNAVSLELGFPSSN